MAVQTIANLVQGVSQQAAEQRRDSQCEAQFDCLNSASDGVVARPPAEVVKMWPSRTLTGAFMVELSRGVSENYLAGIYGNLPFAINLLTGVDATITGSNASGYLNTVSGVLPRDQFRAQPVEDTTFIASRHVTPAMDPAILSTNRAPEGLVWIRTGGFETTYSAAVSGPGSRSGSVRTMRGDYSGGDPAGLSPNTGAITAEIANKGFTSGSGYTITRTGSRFHIIRGDGADFTLSADDGLGDEGIRAIKGFVTSFEYLPAKGHPNMVVEVQGEDRTQVDNYWVQFTGNADTGAWREIVRPNTQTTIDPETMPHTLTLTGLNAFTWDTADWSTRIAGDATTAPNPGFIGRPLRDVFYHANRLALLHDAGCTWSKAKNPYTYFPDTLQTVLATAPVDIKVIAGSGGKGSATLDFSVQVDESLQLWAQGTQFRVSNGQDNFKQDSVRADPSTAFEYAPGVDPLPVGNSLYFATEAGDFATLRAILFQQGRQQGNVDVSAQINRYLRSGVRWMAASDTLGVMFLVADGDPNAIFVWNYLLQQGEYIQSAWNKWRLPGGGTILWMGIRSNVLRVLQQRAEGVALLQFNLTPMAVDDITGALYKTRLDMRVTQAQVTSLSYSSGTGRTTFTLPYTPAGPDIQVVLAEASGSVARGTKYEVVSVTGAVVVVEGDLSGGKKFYAGQVITAERTESTFAHRTERGAVPYDELSVNRFGVKVSTSGYTRVEVTDSAGEQWHQEHSGWTSGLPNSLLGGPALLTGLVAITVERKAEDASIRIVNDTFLPSYWQSAFYDFKGVGGKANP